MLGDGVSTCLLSLLSPITPLILSLKLTLVSGTSGKAHIILGPLAVGKVALLLTFKLCVFCLISCGSLYCIEQAQKNTLPTHTERSSAFTTQNAYQGRCFGCGRWQGDRGSKKL